ncbi:unnamed protein product [Adineta steineri]|uniref:Uncharacterized protein n=1 Tax=Adineta steineri TaxID=433720 RepID=A0A816AZY7_9BILA|nr:unnamed protein product [Adineta steineri]CAF1602303.1 unnamed protein product [Adineta steineri]
MPLNLRHIFDQIPVLSLRYYALISTSLLFGNIFYFHHLIQSNNNNSSIINNFTLINNQTIFYFNAKPFSLSYIQTLLSIIISQTLSLLILVNAIYCLIALFSKQLQVFIFGELRFVELQRIKDKFWNYAFYKFCFLFGVLGLENLNELILWISWFYILAVALLFCQLTKDRFELLSISISIPHQSFKKIFGLLLSLLCLCFGLFLICFCIGFKYGGLSIFFFMFAETILLTLDTCYLLFKFIFNQQQQSNEYRSHILYYVEFLFDMLTLTIDIFHHLQMLFYHQTFMSMSSLIFFMQLKPLFNELTQRLKRHKSYRLAMILMQKKYPLLTKYDLEEKFRLQNHTSTLDEVCSICWEKFEKARCLPCGHLFHENCLRSWLEQDTTCPICRVSLHDDTIHSAQNSRLWPSLNFPRQVINNEQRGGRNHLFRFDGNRYSSWLPSFSIVINHNFPFRLTRARLTGVQLTSMAQSVQQIFPQIPFEVILANLQQTQSIDTTIEHIIEQRIQFESPPPEEEEEEGIVGSEESSYTSSSEIDESNERNTLINPTEPVVDDNENFTWPLDPNIPFDNRKQLLISYMRRRYLEREHRLQLSSQKSDQ